MAEEEASAEKAPKSPVLEATEAAATPPTTTATATTTATETATATTTATATATATATTTATATETATATTTATVTETATAKLQRLTLVQKAFVAALLTCCLALGADLSRRASSLFTQYLHFTAYAAAALAGAWIIGNRIKAFFLSSFFSGPAELRFIIRGNKKVSRNLTFFLLSFQTI